MHQSSVRHNKNLQFVVVPSTSLLAIVIFILSTIGTIDSTLIKYNNVAYHPVLSQAERTLCRWKKGYGFNVAGLICNKGKQVSVSKFCCTKHFSLSDTDDLNLFLSEEDRSHIERLIEKRSKARWEGEFSKADKLRDLIEDFTVVIPWQHILETETTNFGVENQVFQNFKDHYHSLRVVITDLPRSKGGGSDWSLAPVHNSSIKRLSNTEDNVLQLAHAALGMVVTASEQGVNVKEEVLSDLVKRAKERLKVLKRRKIFHNLFYNATGMEELHGRKAADAAFWFALAGVVDNDCVGIDCKSEAFNLYDQLVNISTEELLRFGSKSSCRPKDILHIVERIAMAGIVCASSNRLYNVAAQCLEMKTAEGENQENYANGRYECNSNYEHIIKELRSSTFGLHHNRPLLGLWRFSTRQRKQRLFLQNTAHHYSERFQAFTFESDSDRQIQYDWPNVFRDPTRPLIVDIGCGMGVSLLGLARTSLGNGREQDTQASHWIQINWNECNFIGIDLSRVAIRYAKGICERWNLSDRLCFVVDPAETSLAKIRETYQGPIVLIMIQFPTPFRFQNNALTNFSHDVQGEFKSASNVSFQGCNSQLPKDANSCDFMVTENLLSKIRRLIRNTGKMLIQSNCEDVAVHIMNMAVKKVGFEPVRFSHAITTQSRHNDGSGIPRRAQKWIAMGGERASGRYWSSTPILPPIGQTETEVACISDNKPVHRSLFICT